VGAKSLYAGRPENTSRVGAKPLYADHRTGISAMGQTYAFTASLGRAKLLKSKRYTYKNVTTKQGTCISEIKPSNAIVGLKEIMI
jgi:hypothetical protein